MFYIIVSDCCLTPNSPIFQLYHCELIFNQMAVIEESIVDCQFLVMYSRCGSNENNDVKMRKSA